jgi:colanic acid/amylovoran biosynthesis glycosyltransferase
LSITGIEVKEKKLRLAIYSGVIPSTTFIENLIRALSDHHVEVFLFGSLTKRPAVTPKHVKLYPTYSGKLSKRIQFTFRLIHLFFRHFKAFLFICRTWARNKSFSQIARYTPVLLHPPDIFHIQWAKSTAEWMFLQENFNISVVLSLRGAHINYSPLADAALANTYRKVFPKLSGAHAVSKDLAAKGTLYGLPEHKIRVIHTGLPDHAFADKLGRFESGKTLSILSIGRIHWKKGYDVALDGLSKLAKNNIEFHYTIIAGKANEELIYHLHDLGLTHSVDFINKMPQDQLLEKLGSADIFLLPSVEEGIANVAVEAMARGTLVLSSDCGGMPELITDGETGFLFRSYDANHLAEKIREIAARDAEDIHTIRKRALDHVKSHFTLKRLGNEMVEWYREIAFN